MKLHTDLTSDAVILSTSVTRSDGLYARPLKIARCPMLSKNVTSLSAAYNISAFNTALPRSISASESLGDLRYAVAACVIYKDYCNYSAYNYACVPGEHYHRRFIFVKRQNLRNRRHWVPRTEQNQTIRNRCKRY